MSTPPPPPNLKVALRPWPCQSNTSRKISSNVIEAVNINRESTPKRKLLKSKELTILSRCFIFLDELISQQTFSVAGRRILWFECDFYKANTALPTKTPTDFDKYVTAAYFFTRSIRVTNLLTPTITNKHRLTLFNTWLPPTISQERLQWWIHWHQLLQTK